MKKINKMIIGMANFALLGLVLMPNAMADTIKCSDLTNEELKYIAEQSDPEILDLTCSNGTPFTDEYLDSSNNMQEYISSIGEYFEDRVTPYSTQVLQVPEYIQEKNNWCGPANIKQVLQYYNGKNLGHYLTVSGYIDEWQSQSIAYVDTFSYDYGKGNVAGFHIDSKANVYKTVSNGSRYIIHDKYTAEL